MVVVNTKISIKTISHFKWVINGHKLNKNSNSSIKK